MPGGDRTGPLGMGPLTGRGAGLCAGYGMRGYPGTALRRGLRFRPRWGLSSPGGAYGLHYSSTSPLVDEERVLEEQIGQLKGELEVMERRLQEISSQE